MVAVHADRLESDLTPIPQETLELWRNTGTGPKPRMRTAKPQSSPGPRVYGATLCYWS